MKLIFIYQFINRFKISLILNITTSLKNAYQLTYEKYRFYEYLIILLSFISVSERKKNMDFFFFKLKFFFANSENVLQVMSVYLYSSVK